MVSLVKNNDIIKAYDEIAPHYKKYSKKYKLYLSKIENLVIEHFNKSPKWLDIGSGDGRRLNKISKNFIFKKIIAIEPSKKMAELCRSNNHGIKVYELNGDEIDQIKEESFNVITALWNVFGHMKDSKNRLKVLKKMKKKLSKDGLIMLDVNNRYNLAYGKFEILKRIIIDTIQFDETRGDASFIWKIGNNKFQSSGHLFTPFEIESLFKKVGLRIVKRISVNYKTGESSNSKFKGQLFYILNNSI